jgi:DNA-binding PadR family transcriptional regulator
MHPYRMQRLIKERGKDQVIRVELRASLYQTIDRLLRDGLIAVQEIERQDGVPDRTIYCLTDSGYAVAVKWLRDMLATPAQDYPEFPAAVSLLPLLTPDDARHHLEIRAAKLADRISSIDQVNQVADVPRLFLLESEYLRLMLETELNWVQSVIADLREGRLTWE